MANEEQTATKTWHLVAAWAWAGIPLTLGVIQTLINSMKLFHSGESRASLNGVSERRL